MVSKPTKTTAKRTAKAAAKTTAKTVAKTTAKRAVKKATTTLGPKVASKATAEEKKFAKIVDEVEQGLWNSGRERDDRLRVAGVDPALVNREIARRRANP